MDFLCAFIIALTIAESNMANISSLSEEQESKTATVTAKLCQPEDECSTPSANEANNCNDFCRCMRNPGYFFDEVENKCIEMHMNTSQRYENYAELITLEGERVFKGLLGAAAFFVISSTICVTAALCYCWRIVCTDNVLKRNVRALEKKHKRNTRDQQVHTNHNTDNSCVMVGQTGIMVV